MNSKAERRRIFRELVMLLDGSMLEAEQRPDVRRPLRDFRASMGALIQKVVRDLPPEKFEELCKRYRVHERAYWITHARLISNEGFIELEETRERNNLTRNTKAGRAKSRRKACASRQ